MVVRNPAQNPSGEPVIPARPDALPIANAAIFHLKGDLTSALRCLTTVAPALETADLLRARGYLQIELKDFAGAAESYAGAAARQPESVENWFQWGFSLQKAGRSAEALEKLEKAQSLGGSWIEIPLARSIALLGIKEYRRAISAAEECLVRDSGYVPALFAKAVALHLTWEIPHATEVYLTVLKHNPAHVPALMNLITAGMQQKKYDDVRRHAGALLQIEPQNTLAIEGLGIAAFATNDFGQAREHFKKLTELAPDQAEHWLNLGVSQRRLGLTAESIESFLRARQIRPDSVQAHTQLGDALWKSGDLAAARACYEAAVRKWPEREELTLSLSYILEELKAVAEAEQVCAEFCKRRSDRPQVWFRLGCLEWQRADTEGSLDSFGKALALQPVWLEAEINFGLANLAANRLDDAEKAFGSILEREPDNIEATKGLATAALARQQDERALGLHLRLLDLGEATADVHFNCGVLSHRLNRLKEAADHYRAALKIRNEFAEALLNLGHTLKSIGEGEQAKDFWIPALELQPEFALSYFSRK